jgi:hypothetical protein
MANTVYVFPSNGDGDFLGARVCASARDGTDRPAIVLVGAEETHTGRRTGEQVVRVTPGLLHTLPPSRVWAQAAPLAEAKLYLLSEESGRLDVVRHLDRLLRQEDCDIVEFVTVGGPFRVPGGGLSWFPRGRAGDLMRDALGDALDRSRLSVLAPGAAADVSSEEALSSLYACAQFSEVAAPVRDIGNWGVWAVNYCSEGLAVALAAMQGYRGTVETAPRGDLVECVEPSGRVFTADGPDAWAAEMELQGRHVPGIAETPSPQPQQHDRDRAFSWKRMHQLRRGGSGTVEPDRDWDGIQEYARPDLRAFPLCVPPASGMCAAQKSTGAGQ